MSSQPDGFLALPPNGSGDPVLVLHAWWGLNDTIKALCRRLAEAGYVAFAPDMFHGRVADNISDAEQLVQSHDGERTTAVVAAAVEYLAELAGQNQPGLAIMAFSFGVWYAIEASIAFPDRVSKVIAFYGSGEGEFSAARAEYQFHYAENDPYEPRESREGLAAALHRLGVPATFFIYPDTGHWFFEPDRVDAYDAGAAELAWERALSFLNRR